MQKKGSAAVIALGAILLIVILVWAYTATRGECGGDSDCGEDRYCGVDRECHQIPVIEKTVQRNSLLLPSLILGVAIVIGALLLHIGRQRNEQELQDHYENYYRQWYESQVDKAPAVQKNERDLENTSEKETNSPK